MVCRAADANHVSGAESSPVRPSDWRQILTWKITVKVETLTPGGQDNGSSSLGCCGQLISNSLPSGSFIPTA
jgi:hypothetical protein